MPNLNGADCTAISSLYFLTFMHLRIQAIWHVMFHA